MTKRFRPWDPKQKWLLPPEITEFIPEGHAAHFVRDLVVEELDLSAILGTYSEERGYPPFHPAMMVALLLYAYTQGVFSSRKIAKGCIERMDFAAVTGFQKPDFRTIGVFRRRHLAALGGLFQQVLLLCRRSGLVNLGHVALDGTKVRANASKHKAMSYDRMEKADSEFADVVKGWLEAAEVADLGEDSRFHNRQGDELPEWVSNKVERMKKIREAKAALEQEAAEKAKSKRKDDDEDPPDPPKPDPKAQRNFTDPESRVMPTKDGFQQCYNAQAGVDAKAQVVVACSVGNSSADNPTLLTTLDQIKANLGRKPKVCSADAGYSSESNLEGLRARKIRGYIATGRQKHGTKAAANPRLGRPESLLAQMRERLKRGGWRSPYRLRKQIVEPVFGQIKHGMGFRQFLLRGLAQVQQEWAMVCTAHNLLKLIRASA
jgi:transposase/IS5 family transposase